jgi:hypothetical protein
MSMGEMYSLVTRQEKNWGVQGYKVPKKYFDHIKSKKEKEQFEASQRQVIHPLLCSQINIAKSTSVTQSPKRDHSRQTRRRIIDFDYRNQSKQSKCGPDPGNMISSRTSTSIGRKNMVRLIFSKIQMFPKEMLTQRPGVHTIPAEVPYQLERTEQKEL